MSSLGHLGDQENFQLGKKSISIIQSYGPAFDDNDFVIRNNPSMNYVQSIRDVLEFDSTKVNEIEILPPPDYFNISEITENYSFFIRQRFTTTNDNDQGLTIFCEDTSGNVYDEGEVEDAYWLNLTVDNVPAETQTANNIQLETGETGEQFIICWGLIDDQDDPEDNGIYFDIKGFLYYPDNAVEDSLVSFFINAKLNLQDPNDNLSTITFGFNSDSIDTTSGDLLYKFDFF